MPPLVSHWVDIYAILATGKMTSSTKPEVRNVLHCYQRRIEPRPHTYSWSLDAWSLRYTSWATSWQIDRHTDTLIAISRTHTGSGVIIIIIITHDDGGMVTTSLAMRLMLFYFCTTRKLFETTQRIENSHRITLHFSEMKSAPKTNLSRLLAIKSVTRHRASTSMYSLTFCVCVMSPERHYWKPAVQAAAVMLRTPPSPAGH